MHLITTLFSGNPNIGLYGYCTDKICLLPPEVQDKHVKEVEEVLNVPVHRVTMAGTSMLGVFLAGIGKKLLVPSIAFDHEIEALKALGFEVTVIQSDITALGNNILVNKNGGLISSDFSELEQKEIADALGVPFKQGRIADLPNVGSMALVAKNGCLVHSEAADFELEFVETLLKVDCTRGSINGGNPYIKAGLLANANGIIAGGQSSGIELDAVDKALGFVEVR